MKILHLLTVQFLFPLLIHSQIKETFSVYFDFNKHDLTNKAIARIDSFFQSNKKNFLAVQFELKGYCDNRGTDNYNNELSDSRVTTVKNYLLDRGITSDFILSSLGFGEMKPLNENRTEGERQLNRRVDIFIIRNEPMTVSVGEKNQSLKQKIADSSAIKGSNIILRNLNFVGGMHQLLPESQPIMEELLDAMRSWPNLVIQIEGHICCQSGDADGEDQETGVMNLSEARAKAIYDYLLQNGIEAKRISYKGYGHSMPLYAFPEQSEEERQQNRRVEIKIINK